MDVIFEIVDKFGKKVHLSKERWKHILKHPHMSNHLESIQLIIKNPQII